MKILRTLFAAALAAAFSLSAFAADTSASPAGHWQWPGVGAGGVPAQVNCELNWQDGVLKGTARILDASIEISDASFKDGVVAFSMVRMIHDGAIRFEEKYSGKIEGDTLTGTYDRPTPPSGERATTAWKATRTK